MPTSVFRQNSRTLLVLTALTVIAMAATAVPRASCQGTSDLGDACQLTNSVAACASLAKSWNPKASASFYAAMATSDATGKAGVAHGQTSESAAEQAAVANCKAVGAKDCDRVTYVENKCLAFAVSVTKNASGRVRRDFAAGAYEDRTTAGNYALTGCRESGGQQCVLRVAACAGDNPAFPSRLPMPAGGKPGSVDPHWVGTWALDINGENGGRWVWQISSSGTYELHSEAFDNTPTNVGTFSAQGGHYTLHATNITWDDSGTYVYQAPATMVATGKLGTGTWHKIAGEDE